MSCTVSWPPSIAGPAAEVARHLKAAGQDDAAADRLAHAASEALRVGAVAQAIAFLQEALKLRPDDPALLLELAQAYAYNGLRSDAEEALDRALRRSIPPTTPLAARAPARGALVRGRALLAAADGRGGNPGAGRAGLGARDRRAHGR